MAILEFSGMERYMSPFRESPTGTGHYYSSNTGATPPLTPSEFSAASATATTGSGGLYYDFSSPVPRGGIGVRYGLLGHTFADSSAHFPIITLRSAANERVAYLARPTSGEVGLYVQGESGPVGRAPHDFSVWTYFELVWDAGELTVYVDSVPVFSHPINNEPITGLRFATWSQLSWWSNYAGIFDDFYACDFAPGATPPLGPVVVRHYQPTSLEGANGWLSGAGGAVSLGHLTDTSDSTLAYTTTPGAQLELKYTPTLTGGAVRAVRINGRYSDTGDATGGLGFTISKGDESREIDSLSLTSASVIAAAVTTNKSPSGADWTPADLDGLTVRMISE